MMMFELPDNQSRTCAISPEVHLKIPPPFPLVYHTPGILVRSTFGSLDDNRPGLDVPDSLIFHPKALDTGSIVHDLDDNTCPAP